MKKYLVLSLLLTLLATSFSYSQPVIASDPQIAAPSYDSMKPIISSDMPKSLSFSNVYEFEANTYQSLASLDNVNFKFITRNKAELTVNSKSFKLDEKIDYEIKKSDGITLLYGSKEVDEETLISFNMVFDDIKNANGNITLTQKVVNENNDVVDYVEKNIRFTNGEDYAREIIESIEKNKEQNALTGATIETSQNYPTNFGILSSVDYPTNIHYKYGNKFYAGWFGNQSYLVGNGGQNPIQIKIKPLGAAYSYTDVVGDTGSLKEDLSGITKLNFRIERISGVGMLMYPIVPSSPNPTFSVDISYSFPVGIGIGTTLNIPISGSNTYTDGNTGRWDLNNIFFDMEKNGSSVDAFYLYGHITGNGSGTTKFSTGAHVTLGAVYVFGHKPAAIVNIKEDIAFTDKTVTIQSN